MLPTRQEILMVNSTLAKEFIETRLDIEPTKENVDLFAGLINYLEAKNV